MLGIDRGHIRFCQGQSLHDGGVAVACRLQQRCHGVGVMRIAVGAGIEQQRNHFRVAGGAGLHQRGALVLAARVHPRLVPKQQLRTARIVIAGNRRE